MTKLNTGLSGCSLELINDRVLRKYSPTTDYNSRLLSQADKQVVFGNRIYKNIDAPKVYDTQQNYFDMEYIAGKSFEEFFSVASVNDIEFVVSTLFDYFDTLISTARSFDATNKILTKIDSLKEKSSHKKYIEFLRKYVEDNRIIVPHTFCHGDLTFANIIFHKNRLFFIDFLDCYVDTFLSDLVKLKQDLHHLWAVHNQDVYSVRIHQIYQYIWDKLEVRYESFMNESFHILDVMNALRIEPYLTSDDQRVILEGIVKSTELYAISCSSDGGAINQISETKTEVDVVTSNDKSHDGDRGD
jgi:tRNA A-37 threonylcarbamoyl transferase component Bud32